MFPDLKKNKLGKHIHENTVNKTCNFQWEMGQMWKSIEKQFQKSTQKKTPVCKKTLTAGGTDDLERAIQKDEY